MSLGLTQGSVGRDTAIGNPKGLRPLMAAPEVGCKSGDRPLAPQGHPGGVSWHCRVRHFRNGVPGADPRGEPEGVIPGVTSGVAPGVRKSVLRASLSSRLSALSGTRPCSDCMHIMAAGPQD